MDIITSVQIISLCLWGLLACGFGWLALILLLTWV